MKNFLKEFKDFIATGDLVEIAVAFILALAIKAVIDELRGTVTFRRLWARILQRVEAAVAETPHAAPYVREPPDPGWRTDHLRPGAARPPLPGVHALGVRPLHPARRPAGTYASDRFNHWIDRPRSDVLPSPN